MNEGEEAQIAQRLAVQQAAARVLLESNSLDEAMSEVLRLLATQLGWSLAVYWAADQGPGSPPVLRCRGIWADDSVLRAPVVEATRTASLRAGEDPPGQAMSAREPIWIEELAQGTLSPRLQLAAAAGLQSVAAFPLRERDTVLAVVELYARDRRAADDGALHLMTAIGHQLALVRRRIEAQTAALGALERTRDELETVLRALPDVVAVRDGAGRVVYANEPAPAEAGTPVAQLQRASAAEMADTFQMWDDAGRPVGADDVPGARAARGENEDRVLRVRRVGSPAEDHWISVKATPAEVVAGGARRVVMVLRDVTVDRRHQEWTELLGAADAALRGASELGPALENLAVVACRSIATNCAVALRQRGGDLRLSALARAGVAADPAADPAAAAAQIKLAAAAVEAGRGTLAHAGGRSTIVVPLVLRGQSSGALVLEQDARGYQPADLVAAEELAGRAALAIENIQLRTEGQEAARSREDLLAIVSHDLRNPLGVVMASSALLLKSPLTDPPGKEGRSRRQVEAIQRAGTRMNRLIRDLLDFAAIQAGRLTVSSHPRGVGELVREVFDALAPQAEAKSLKLIDGSPESPLRVSCDHDRVIQMFDNVVGNAVKFSNEGGSVTVAAEPDGAMVRFSVTDEGPGISPEELPYVFDRAYQAKRRNRDGIGIGLSIARGIVEAHGGRMWAESPAASTGRGTRFFFTLPAAQA
ncbi:MAG TPA: ATP-binding protein [Polyangia bacterium]|nr:ATP-binding protein [Polyangia bacterium]